MARIITGIWRRIVFFHERRKTAGIQKYLYYSWIPVVLYRGCLGIFTIFLYRGCLVPRLPVAGKHFLEPDCGCRVAPQQVEIRLPRRRDTHAIILSCFQMVWPKWQPFRLYIIGNRTSYFGIQIERAFEEWTLKIMG